MPLGVHCKVFQVPKYNTNVAKGELREVYKVEKRPKNDFYKHRKHSFGTTTHPQVFEYEAVSTSFSGQEWVWLLVGSIRKKWDHTQGSQCWVNGWRASPDTGVRSTAQDEVGRMFKNFTEMLLCLTKHEFI